MYIYIHIHIHIHTYIHTSIHAYILGFFKNGSNTYGMRSCVLLLL